MIEKVISGGQTGADQGGLIAAHFASLKTGGTAPKNYMTSTGPNALLECLGLIDHGTLKTRTKKNITDSDGTIILAWNMKSPGTVMTINECKLQNKPLLCIDVSDALIAFSDTGSVPVALLSAMYKDIHRFVTTHPVRILNIAGNRELPDSNAMTRVSAIIMSFAFQYLKADDLLIQN